MHPTEFYTTDLDSRYAAHKDDAIKTLGGEFQTRESVLVKCRLQSNNHVEFCNVKGQIIESLGSREGTWLDAGCGGNNLITRVKSKLTGFDAYNDMNPETIKCSFKEGLNIFQPNSFDIVSGFGSIHSVISSTRNSPDQVLSRITSDSNYIDVLESPLDHISFETYAVDVQMTLFHIACMTHWSKDIITFTVRNRFITDDQVSAFINILNLKTEKIINPDTKSYTDNCIKFYEQCHTLLDEKEKVLLLRQLRLKIIEYKEAPAIGYILKK